MRKPPIPRLSGKKVHCRSRGSGEGVMFYVKA